MHHEFAHPKNSGRTRTAGLLAAGSVLLACALLPPTASAQPQQRSVPAEYLRGLTLPGALDEFKRPNGITVDSESGEILVADGSNNRIVIFDENGIYRFEFGGRDDFATPFDVAVDSRGFIYVLGATRDGNRVHRYDFDGTNAHPIQIPELGYENYRISHISIDEEDRLYLLEMTRGSIFVLSRDGELLSSFAVDTREGSREETEIVLGSLHASQGLVYVPLSSFGTVQVYDLEGALVRSYGYRGNNVGELNFPTAVTVKDDGMVMVLDKHRFNVLCFAQDGKFLGEFGGKGMRPGWFYHPTLLAVDTNGLVYIGQILGHRVDICRIPDFIRDAHSRSAEMGAALSTRDSLRVAWMTTSTLDRGRVYTD